MKGLLKSVNWKYGLGELLLIFLGITAALYFNNWNEAQKKRQLEIETLQEIHQGISADLSDIKNNIEGYTFRQECYQYITNHINQQQPITRGFLDTARYLRGFTYFISNIGPFETLKSRGLGLISNKAVRLGIAKYYDEKHEWLKVNETRHHEFYKSLVIPVFLKYFEVGNGFTPYNYEALLKDKEAHQILHWAINDIYYLIRIYKQLAIDIEDLLKAIEAEIGDSQK